MLFIFSQKTFCPQNVLVCCACLFDLLNIQARLERIIFTLEHPSPLVKRHNFVKKTFQWQYGPRFAPVLEIERSTRAILVWQESKTRRERGESGRFKFVI